MLASVSTPALLVDPTMPPPSQPTRPGPPCWLALLGLLSLLGSGRPAAAQPDVMPVAPAPPEARELVVWSWRDDTAARIDGVTPMVWVDFNYGHRPPRRGTNYHTARPDHEIARDVLNRIHRLRQAGRLPDGRLALHLWYAGRTHGLAGPDRQPPLFPEDRLPDALAQAGLIEHTQQLMRRVAQRLHLADVQPDFLVLDYEHGATTWQLGRRDRQPNPVAFRQDVQDVWRHAAEALPEALRDPARRDELLDAHPARRRATTIAFNGWAVQRRRLALRRAVFEPWWQAFGQTLPASNYADQVRAWATHDRNGWPQPVNDQLEGNWSSPVAYLSDLRGHRYHRDLGIDLTESQRLAAVWADHRNRVRAALAWSPDVAPWYSNPDFGRPEAIDPEAWRWAWAAGLMHDRRHGVARVLLWSDAAWSPDEIAFARRVFAALAVLPADQTAYSPNLQPVPLEEAPAWLAGWIEQTRQAIKAVDAPEAPTPTR